MSLSVGNNNFVNFAANIALRVATGAALAKFVVTAISPVAGAVIGGCSAIAVLTTAIAQKLFADNKVANLLADVAGTFVGSYYLSNLALSYLSLPVLALQTGAIFAGSILLVSVVADVILHQLGKGPLSANNG